MKIGIIWDLDGTLLDTLEDLTDAVNYTMDRFGCPWRSLQEVRSFVGNGIRNLVAKSLPENRQEVLEEAVEVYRAYYNAHSKIKTCPYPGIPEVLEKLGAEYPMAIASNKPDSAVKPLCREFFGEVYALGERAECPRKPAPDIVHRAMEAIGVEKCGYVGDSEVDILTSANAKVSCLSVLWGFRDRDVLEAAGGKYFCEAPEQLYDCIKKIIANEE